MPAGSTTSTDIIREEYRRIQPIHKVLRWMDVFFFCDCIRWLNSYFHSNNIWLGSHRHARFTYSHTHSHTHTCKLFGLPERRPYTVHQTPLMCWAITHVARTICVHQKSVSEMNGNKEQPVTHCTSLREFTALYRAAAWADGWQPPAG